MESTPATSGAPAIASNVVPAVAVTDGMHAVAQGDVADVDVARGHLAPAVLLEWAAIRSAVAFAAEVMMSRLPA